MKFRLVFLRAFCWFLCFQAAGAVHARAMLQRGYESDLKDADASLQAELGALSTGASAGTMQDADPLVNAALVGDPFEVGADHPGIPDQPEVNGDAPAAVASPAAPVGEQKLALWAASQGVTESSLQNEVNSLKGQSSTLQKDMATAAALRLQANQTQEELERMHEKVGPTHIAALQNQAATLEKKHNELLMQLREKDGEIATLERDLKPLRAKVHAAQKEAAELKARSKNTGLLQGKLQAARAEEKRLRHTVDLLRQRLVALQGTSELPRETVIDAALARTENATALLEAQNKMIKQQKVDAQKQADARVALLQAKVHRAETRRAQLEADVRHQKALVANARKNLTFLVQRKKALLTERGTLQKQITGLGPVEEELRTKGAEVKRLRRQVALLDKSVSTARSSLLFEDNSRLEEQVEEVKKQNTDLLEQRKDQEKQGIAMEVELKNAKKAVVSLRNEVGRAQTMRKHNAGVWRHVKSINRENAALQRGIALLTQRLRRIHADSADQMNSDSY